MPRRPAKAKKGSLCGLQAAVGGILLSGVCIFTVVHFTHSEDLARQALASEAALVSGLRPRPSAGRPPSGASNGYEVATDSQPVEPAQGAANDAADADLYQDPASQAQQAEPPAEAAALPPAPPPPAAPKAGTVWKLHSGKSCQGYADGDTTERTLEESKRTCMTVDSCVGVECIHGSISSCTIRAVANFVPYGPADCYERIDMDENGKPLTAKVHKDYNRLLKEYPFQQVTTQSGNQVNVILVRSQMSASQKKMYEKYKDDILFIGISSMNDYPLNEDGSCSEFCDMFPGFLHMMRDPEKKFPPHVKHLLMSQSDFSLPNFPERDYSVPKKYDFTYSASDCDVHNDCHGWCGWSKNMSFVREALKVMCGEYKLKGVLVATKDKSGKKACSIPPSCDGLITQTTYLANQMDYFNYLKQSKFAFLPQVHDASPRVSSQALALDVPILMNWHIRGGWKYVNEKTGEFFHDMSDFKEALDKILAGSDTPHHYEPRKWVLENYGNPNSGKRLLEFVKSFNKVTLPKGTKYLLT